MRSEKNPTRNFECPLIPADGGKAASGAFLRRLLYQRSGRLSTITRFRLLLKLRFGVVERKVEGLFL